MNLQQWQLLKQTAAMETPAAPPVALIIDSPWIPGYSGISTLDYFTMPDQWLAANLQVMGDFPEVIFLPGFWVEYGMTNEPSAFGCKLSFFEQKTPFANQLFKAGEEFEGLAEAVESMKVPNPRTDGLLPLVLNQYRKMEPKVNDAGHLMKIVCARGPLAIAAHLMGVTDFLLAMKLEPDMTRRLLKIIATLVKDWLEAQANVLHDVEGIMVLDDIMGLMSETDYLEFAHPYFREIFGAFPTALKILHNDTNNKVPLPYVADLGVNIFNFSHLIDIAEARRLVGEKVCLMGNIPPLDVLALADPKRVKEETAKCLTSHGNKPGLLLSAGGGVSPGTPTVNIRAMVGRASLKFEG
jgi:uroporphyrinogen-III decarboxylase